MSKFQNKTNLTDKQVRSECDIPVYLFCRHFMENKQLMHSLVGSNDM